MWCVIPPRSRDQLRDKMISGIQEVRARGALTICLAEEGDEEIARVRRCADPAAAGAGAAAAAGGGRAAAVVRVRVGDAAGPRRRPTAQPRQVRHGRIADRRWALLASASTSWTSSGSVSRWSGLPACGIGSSRPMRRLGCLPSLGGPVRGQGGPGQGAGRPCRTGLARRRGGLGGVRSARVHVAGHRAGCRRRLGVTGVHLSLSHDAGIASAVVVLEQ